MHVGIELDLHFTRNGARCAVRSLRRAVHSRRFAEGTVQPRRESHEHDHRRDDQDQKDQRLAVLVLGYGSVHQLIPVLAMVMKNSSTTKAPSSQAVIRARSRWRRTTS